jgi:hypothetical protein
MGVPTFPTLCNYLHSWLERFFRQNAGFCCRFTYKLIRFYNHFADIRQKIKIVLFQDFKFLGWIRFVAICAKKIRHYCRRNLRPGTPSPLSGRASKANPFAAMRWPALLIQICKKTGKSAGSFDFEKIIQKRYDSANIKKNRPESGRHF